MLTRLRHHAPLLLAAAAVCALAPSAAAAKAKPKPCRPSGSVAVAATPKVRVFTRENEQKGWEKLYACRYKGGTPIVIATEYPDAEFPPWTSWDDDSVRIAGNYAAIVVSKENEDDQYDSYAVVVDTATRRVVGRAAVTGEYTDITDLVLDARGRVAFLSEVRDLVTQKVVERRIDRLDNATRATSLVASDLTIKPGTLKLSGAGVLSWTQGGATKTGPLAR